MRCVLLLLLLMVMMVSQLANCMYTASGVRRTGQEGAGVLHARGAVGDGRDGDDARF